MKLQYLGDSKDSFKWDYHDFLSTHLGVETLVVVPMLTAADGTGQGVTEPTTFPASQGVLEFCRELRRSRELETIRRLPEFSKAHYSVKLHNPSVLFQSQARESYFRSLQPEARSIVFLDPDNGFEPTLRTEKHVAYADVSGLADRVGDSGLVTVFHHFRRRSFEDDFSDIQRRLEPLVATALYWHSLMFVAVSTSSEQTLRVREANLAYATERPVQVVGRASPPRQLQRRVSGGQRATGSSCQCGCGTTTKGEFAPGHDQKLRAALERTCGGLIELRKLVEREHGAEAVHDELLKSRK